MRRWLWDDVLYRRRRIYFTGNEINKVSVGETSSSADIHTLAPTTGQQLGIVVTLAPAQRVKMCVVVACRHVGHFRGHISA